MNPKYFQYGLIAGVVLLVLYAISKSGGNTSTTFSTMPVNVNYQADSAGVTANLAARTEAFNTLAGVGNQIYQLRGDVAQAAITNETARQISRNETLLGQYALDTSERLQQLMGDQRFQEMQFQAAQVNATADAFRHRPTDQQASILNALASIWGGSTGYPFPQSTGGATGIINGIGNVLGRIGGLFGLG